MCPKRVKFIAVLSIAYAAITSFPKVLLLVNRELYENTKLLVSSVSSKGLLEVPFSLQITHALIGTIVMIISSIYMLHGKRWALNLWSLWVLGVLILTLAVAGFSVHFFSKLTVAVALLAMLHSGKSKIFFRSTEIHSHA